MPQTEFAGILRRFRHAAGLSQEELANRAGLSGDAVAALERGRRRAPRPLTVRLLADALELTGDRRTEFISASRQGVYPARRPARQAPVAADEFIGRSADLSEIVHMLTEADVRLVTLTGPGGVGKTRLAIEAAHLIANDAGRPVSWVPLGACSDEASVTAAVASAVGLHLPSDRAHLEVLAEHLRGEHRVLFLDNCEHVLDAVVVVSDALLRTCPWLRVVATTRELLWVQGEIVRPVQPLGPADAVRMFVTRATAHGVRPGDDQVAQVRQICTRLDGIPLAIELAAARVNVLTLSQIADELRTSFRILSTDNRRFPERQRTLHAAIDWSYQLLTPDEQRFFAALSVFSGGWTIAAAQAVWASESPPTMDMTARLADKSLVVVRRDGPTARYEMFDVIREYAAEQLDRAGLRDRMELAHLDYFTRLAEEAEPELRRPDHSTRLAQLDAELDNFRVAMRRATERHPSVHALRLAASLYMYCYLREHYSEGRAWLDQALRRHEQDPVGSADAAHHAKALLGSGHLAFLQCAYDAADRALGSAYALYEELADASGAALTLRYLGSVARERGTYELAEDLHRRSLRIYAELAHDAGVAWARHHLGFVSWLRERWSDAREHARAALAVFRTIGDTEGIAWSLISQGSVALYEDDVDQAETLLRQALIRARREGFREGMAWAQNQLGAVAIRRGEIGQAAGLLEESFTTHQQLGDRWRAASVLEALAAVVRLRGQPRQAVFLLGVAAGTREEIGAPVPPCERPAHDATVDALRAELDGGTFARAWAEGVETPLHQI